MEDTQDWTIGIKGISNYDYKVDLDHLHDEREISVWLRTYDIEFDIFKLSTTDLIKMILHMDEHIEDLRALELVKMQWSKWDGYILLFAAVAPNLNTKDEYQIREYVITTKSLCN